MTAAADGDTIVVLPRNYAGVTCKDDHYRDAIEFPFEALAAR